MNKRSIISTWTALAICLTCICSANTSVAQSRFELLAPHGSDNSNATLETQSLRITDGRGRETLYQRDHRYDSEDSQWMGFFSSQVQQVIRWPRSGTGNMQIGQLNTGGAVVYRPSQMTIRRSRTAVGDVLPPDSATLQANARGTTRSKQSELSRFFSGLWSDQPSSPTVIQLSVQDAQGNSSVLARQRERLAMSQDLSNRNADWYVVPAGRGMVRLTGNENGRVTTLAASPLRSLVLEAATGDLRQLWQILPSPVSLGSYIIENVAFRGLVLGGGQGNNLGLQPLAFATHQFWLPISPILPVPFDPLWRTTRSSIRPNPPLEPAQLELQNSHRNPLIVLVGDRRQGETFTQVRIEPQSQATLTLERDAGATLIETYEIRSIHGVWEQSEFVTAVPPAQLYDLSVYEEQLQSIAIDRTGTSPNPIEDVNFVPKSLGWLPIPAGDALAPVSRMDIYQVAKAARNPGAVRRFDPKSFNKRPATDPLEAILNDAQSKAPPAKKERRKL